MPATPAPPSWRNTIAGLLFVVAVVAVLAALVVGNVGTSQVLRGDGDAVLARTLHLRPAVGLLVGAVAAAVAGARVARTRTGVLPYAALGGVVIIAGLSLLALPPLAECWDATHIEGALEGAPGTCFTRSPGDAVVTPPARF